jgi:hypothetical protein
MERGSREIIPFFFVLKKRSIRNAPLSHYRRRGAEAKRMMPGGG